MKKKDRITVGKTHERIELKKNSFVDMMELVFNLGGVLIPPLTLIGLGLGLISKKYSEENLNILIKHIQDNEIRIMDIEKLNEESVRNFSFNVQRVIDEVVKERAKEKIIIFANALMFGIENSSIFNNDDNFMEKIDLISKLNMNDFRILLKMDEEKQIISENTTIHSAFRADMIKTVHFLDGKKENFLGFDDHDIHRIYKLVSLGLINEVSTTEIDTFRSSKNKTVLKTESKFVLTEYFDLLKKYIEDQGVIN